MCILQNLYQFKKEGRHELLDCHALQEQDNDALVFLLVIDVIVSAISFVSLVRKIFLKKKKNVHIFSIDHFFDDENNY